MTNPAIFYQDRPSQRIHRRSAEIAEEEHRLNSPLALKKGGLQNWKVRKLKEFIVCNSEKRLSIGELANLVGLSTSHFSRSFSLSFGCSPYRYVLLMRLLAARAMLNQTNLPIKQVAAECGFSDQAHLNRAMRRYFFVSPGEVRKPYRQSNVTSLNLGKPARMVASGNCAIAATKSCVKFGVCAARGTHCEQLEITRLPRSHIRETT